MRLVRRVARSFSQGIGRRSFLGHVATLGAGGGIHGFLSRASAWAAGETRQKRDLVILQPSDITGLDPLASIHTSDRAVSSNIFDTLVRRHPDGTLHPALATAWTRTAATTWQFILRRGVRWHDGTWFTSTDAKYSLDRTYTPVKAARLKVPFQTLDRIEAPDPETLIVHTKRPDPLIPAKL